MLQVMTPGSGATSVHSSSASSLPGKLQAALPDPLMQQRQAIKIGVRAGAPCFEVVRLGAEHRKIVQEPQRALIFRRQRIVAIRKEVGAEIKLQGKAGQQLHADRPVGAFEREHHHLKAGNTLPSGQRSFMRGRVIW